MDFIGGLICVGLALSAIVLVVYKLATNPGKERIDAMDARLRELAHRVATLERSSAAEKTADARPAATVPVAVAPTRPSPDVPPPLPSAPTPERTILRTPPTPAPSLEAFLGGRVMLVAGVVVGLFGIAFFLKYAIDHGWIGPQARVAMGAATGVALLFGGGDMRRRGYDVFGQALMGFGLGALYLSNYFACTRYGMLGEGAAFAVTAALTATGAALAVMRGAPVLAYLGFLGGYLAPALLARPTGELGGLSTWLLLVDAGVLAVLMVRAWRGLDVMTHVAAAVYFVEWYERYGRAGDAVADSSRLAALVAASLVVGLAPPIRRRAAPDALSLACAAAAGALGVVAGHAMLFPERRWALGAAVLALGAVYLAASRLVAARAADARGESAGLLGFAVASLAAAIAVATSGAAVAPALSAVGVAVVYAGTRTRQGVLLVGGVGMTGLAFGDLLLSRLDMFDAVATPFVSERFVVFACPCVAMFVCGRLISRVPDAPAPVATLVAATGLWALPIVIGADMMRGTSGTGDARFEARFAATTAVLAVYGAGVARLFGAGRGAAARALAFGPIAMAALFGSWLFSAGHLGPFTPGLSAAFLAGIVLVAAMLYAASTAPESAREGLSIVPLLYLFGLMTAELHAWGEHRPLDGVTRREAQFAAQVWISIVWASYASALIFAGFLRERAALRWLGLVVFAVTVGKVFLVDMADLGKVYRIASFLVLGVLLVGASFLYQRARKVTSPPTDGRPEESAKE